MFPSLFVSPISCVCSSKTKYIKRKKFLLLKVDRRFSIFEDNRMQSMLVAKVENKKFVKTLKRATR